MSKILFIPGVSKRLRPRANGSRAGRTGAPATETPFPRVQQTSTSARGKTRFRARRRGLSRHHLRAAWLRLVVATASFHATRETSSSSWLKTCSRLRCYGPSRKAPVRAITVGCIAELAEGDNRLELGVVDATVHYDASQSIPLPKRTKHPLAACTWYGPGISWRSALSRSARASAMRSRSHRERS